MNQIESKNTLVSDVKILEDLLPTLRPINKNLLKFSGNGVELGRSYQLGFYEGATFENKCFASILSKPGDSLALGPWLIEYLFSQPYTANCARPDAIVFNTQGQDHWFLTNLYEFKSSKRDRHTSNKLAGFSQLLSELRGSPNYLPRLLNTALGQIIDIPKTIVIPEDVGIEVIFIYGTKNRIIKRHPPITQFKVEFKRLRD